MHAKTQLGNAHGTRQFTEAGLGGKRRDDGEFGLERPPQDTRLGGDCRATRQIGTRGAGLTTNEAQKRMAKDGPNAIVATEEPLWHKAVGYFWGPIPWMIEAAALISFLRHDWPDFFVVMALLIYNAAVGFWQDAKAANALAALRKGLALKAEVLR